MTRSQLQTLLSKATAGKLSKRWFAYRTVHGKATIQVDNGWLFHESDKGTMDDAELVCALVNNAESLLSADEQWAQVRAMAQKAYDEIKEDTGPYTRLILATLKGGDG